MTIYSISGENPQLTESAWVAPQAVVIGRAELAARTSVWFNAVIRADNEPVKIGEGSNVQEGAVLHTDPGFPMDIAANVTIGHQAMLHGCTVGEGSLIGVQAVILNGAVIGKNCLVGAGAVVTEGKVFPDRSLIVGAPAKVVRELTDEQVASLLENAADYVRRADVYRRQLDQVG
ncbi:gamma carbonic anhydrase family protein [Paraburkholderia sabiae]|uniref:Gamma carbonic anhydrase family protein n=1 Tax=Paraburkholderia sabiae TaxID=273251 RepID=A0ABU9QKD3_9BURK|nr:gamma carbonic anhydrase family protein [Paraburkholderia sabiae]WJZ76504.1 gamma carbonic anhydrase family protein [Paraburkholderia sabiae]CAD6560279.1 Protein YrdA [Paraburkholderia sabiae]